MKLILAIILICFNFSCVKRAVVLSEEKEESLSAIPARYRNEIGKVLFNNKVDKVALKLCESGLSPSCLRISKHLNDLLLKEKNNSEKEKIYWVKYYYDTTACLLKDPRGCYNASRWDIFLMNNGHNRKNSVFYFLEKSCQYQKGDACYEVGLRELHDGDKEHSLGYLTQGCMQNHLESCFEGAKVADLLKHSEVAFNMHNKACELGDKKSCYNSGLLAYEMREFELAKRIWNSSCLEKMSTSCYNLACLLFAEKTEEKKEEAYNYLELALKYGMERVVVEFDDDLNDYRKEYRFMRLMNRYVK